METQVRSGGLDGRVVVVTTTRLGHVYEALTRAVDDVLTLRGVVVAATLTRTYRATVAVLKDATVARVRVTLVGVGAHVVARQTCRERFLGERDASHAHVLVAEDGELAKDGGAQGVGVGKVLNVDEVARERVQVGYFDKIRIEFGEYLGHERKKSSVIVNPFLDKSHQIKIPFKVFKFLPRFGPIDRILAAADFLCAFASACIRQN